MVEIGSVLPFFLNHRFVKCPVQLIIIIIITMMIIIMMMIIIIIGVTTKIELLQKAALLGTARSLRKVLEA